MQRLHTPRTRRERTQREGPGGVCWLKAAYDWSFPRHKRRVSGHKTARVWTYAAQNGAWRVINFILSTHPHPLAGLRSLAPLRTHSSSTWSSRGGSARTGHTRACVVALRVCQPRTRAATRVCGWPFAQGRTNSVHSASLARPLLSPPSSRPTQLVPRSAGPPCPPSPACSCSPAAAPSGRSGSRPRSSCARLGE